MIGSRECQGTDASVSRLDRASPQYMTCVIDDGALWTEILFMNREICAPDFSWQDRRHSSLNYLSHRKFRFTLVESNKRNHGDLLPRIHNRAAQIVLHNCDELHIS